MPCHEDPAIAHQGVLSIPATGKDVRIRWGELCQVKDGRISVNGLGFWRREGDMFTENWVFADMIHLFASSVSTYSTASSAEGRNFGNQGLK